jgi:sigma-E factor negative regulatory protein RseA
MQNAPSTLGDLSNREIISAWLDGEAPGNPDLHLSHANRQVWDTYHFIGDVMRSNELAVRPSAQFQVRLGRALDAERPILATPQRKSSLGPAWRIGLSGAAMAAVVATVVWIARPAFVGTGTDATQVLADMTPSAFEDSALSAYLEAHRQMAGPSAIHQVSFQGTGL